jgi:hypothetical protein
MKKTLLSAALLAALGASTQAHALLFNPDGAPGGALNINVGSFDWGPTSFVAVGGNQAVVNFLANAAAPPNGDPLDTTFTVLTHATLIGTLNPSNAINEMSGLGTDYEITMAFGFTERVSNVIPPSSGDPGAIARFATVPTGNAFLEIFYDSAVDSDALTGAGFNNGRLILSGTTVGASTGSFTVETDLPPGALDQSGGNNYPGQLTVIGGGNQRNLAVNDLAWDPLFFLQPLAEFGIQYANISIALPYVSVDPSVCFTTAASGVGIGNSTGGAEECFGQDHVNGLFSAQTLGDNEDIFPL